MLFYDQYESKNNEITMLEYYKTYMNWETERWTKNVISHVGPQGLSVLMHDRGTFFKSSSAVA